MPVHIYDDKEGNFETIGECSLGEWDLATQVDDLKRWLRANRETISKGKYVADIGFTVRQDATGGGAVISIELIHILHDLGMAIYLSEYGFGSDAEP